MATLPQPFNQETALAHYRELMQRVNSGAYEERTAHYQGSGTFPPGGVERALHELQTQAAQAGLRFSWDGWTQCWSLVPLVAEEEKSTAPIQRSDGEEQRDELGLAVSHEHAQQDDDAAMPPTPTFQSLFLRYVLLRREQREQTGETTHDEERQGR